MTLVARRAALAAGVLGCAITLAVNPAPAQSDATAAGAVPTQTTPAAAPRALIASPKLTITRSRLRIKHVRRTMLVGQSLTVRGVLRPHKVGRTVALQQRVRGHWRTIDRAHTNGRGAYRLRVKPSRTGSIVLRVRYRGDKTSSRARRMVGTVNVYRRAFASWYGPGFYGGGLACGGHLGVGTIGVAHKTLPCGTRLKLHYRGRTLAVRVIDRGPYVAGRDYDLTGATKQRLGFGSTGVVLATR